MISKQDCEDLRRKLKVLADEMDQRSKEVARVAIRQDDWKNRDTVVNWILAFHHLEDASMRLGKCIQAIDGGVSVYDKTQVPSTGEPK